MKSDAVAWDAHDSITLPFKPRSRSRLAIGARRISFSGAAPTEAKPQRVYTPTFRWIDRAAMAAAATLESVLVYRLHGTFPEHVWIGLAAIVAAFLFADFISGFVHWMFDSWGTFDTPLVGNFVIRNFREHHGDETAITRHDFVETNGSNALLSLLPLSLALLVPARNAHTVHGVFVNCFCVFLTVFVVMTSQVHKWAHSSHPPAIVALLQRLGVILPPDHHAMHHKAPHDTHYCITSGWLNVTLGYIKFFRRLEAAITWVTGAQPRAKEPEDQPVTNRVLTKSKGRCPPRRYARARRRIVSRKQ